LKGKPRFGVWAHRARFDLSGFAFEKKLQM